MKGLLLRLSGVDADAEAAVRVIAWFDALVARGATLPAVVRATAALAECPAGLDQPGAPPLLVRPDGTVQPVAGVVSGALDLPDGRRVHLERSGGPGPLDELLLERFALAVQLLAPAAPGPHAADPALVELALSAREEAGDRSRALRLLGLAVDRPLRVAAVVGDGGAAVRALVAAGTAGVVRAADVAGVAAVLLQPRGGTAGTAPALRAALDAAPASRAGLGAAVPALDAPTSWRQARLALRFADAGLVDHDELGAPALLAELPAEVLAAHPDVVVVGALAPLDRAALEAFCRTGTLRGAAAALHLHHSSVAARLAHAGSALGWRLDDPAGRFRARVALLASRLSRS